MNKKLILIITIVLFAIPVLLFAKRAHIEYPDKITIKNIEYKAAYEYGNLFQKAFIEAKNPGTGEILWKKEIYKIILNPVMEHDVQWVMITEVKQENGRLIIYNEKKEKFSLDLGTLEVKKPNIFGI